MDKVWKRTAILWTPTPSLPKLGSADPTSLLEAPGPAVKAGLQWSPVLLSRARRRWRRYFAGSQLASVPLYGQHLIDLFDEALLAFRPSSL